MRSPARKDRPVSTGPAHVYWRGEPRRLVRTLAFAALSLGVLGPATPLGGQTFVQLSDLGSNIGPRLTKLVARQRLNRSLFLSIGTKVSFIDQGTVYQFASDPDWSRILVGLKDQWIHEYDNTGAPGGRLLQPLGIDISARKFFYAVDRAKGAILLAEFSPTTQNLVNPAAWTSSQFPRPADIAWDGGTTPLTADFLYVLDDSLSRVSYWDRPTLLWSYRTAGTGVGQFLRPSGICVGKTAAANGGTQFTDNVYVVDRGNRRIVWLKGGGRAPAWLGAGTLPDWDPTDCAVDHFGNLYVVDQINHRLHKFTYSLTLLATYGTYGKGPNNLNTFAWPHAISVPCGLKVVNSQTVWYCEGRVITAEQWSDSSGAVEHYLGMDGAITAQPQPDSVSNGAWFSYSTTDHGTHYVGVLNQSGSSVRALFPAGSWMPPGSHTLWWDGLQNDGVTPAPSGQYYFTVLVGSAYGCSGQSWCQKGMQTGLFYHAAPSSPPCDRPPCPEGPAPGPATEPEPTALFFQQRVLAQPQPLARVSGSAAMASAPADPVTALGSLTPLVREFGVRGLRFSVTRQASSTPVVIRIHSLSGRLVRTLVNQVLAPAVYDIGWDGMDDRGRPAGPGVYFAVLNAGGQRLVQRLILRQAP